MNPKMFAGVGELCLAQEDGGLPTTLATGCAPGDSGLTILNLRFEGGLHVAATSRQHLICFQQMTESCSFECRFADRTVSHEPLTGSVAICPAGIDQAADAVGSVDILVIAIDPGRLALAAAEDRALDARLIERFSGYDPPLLGLGRTLALESASDYPNGPLFWNECASSFIDGLVARHTSRSVSQARGTLGRNVFDRLRDYILAHLDRHVEVSALAKLAGRSPFQFTRVFARSVGMTPHRYIVHLRLQRAIELVRDGRSGLAEIATHTGFADQSHLSRWVRRVYGVSLAQLAPD
jgi:AraC family transcriptional regulator